MNHLTQLGTRRLPLTEDYCTTWHQMHPTGPCPYHAACPRDLSLPVRIATAYAIRATLRGMQGM